MKVNAFSMLFALVGLPLLACDAPPPAGSTKAGAQEAGVAAEGAPAEGAPAEGAGATDSCATFAKQVCDAVGAQNPTCASVTKATTLLSPKACAAGLADFAYTTQKLADAGKACAELTDRLCKDLGVDTQTCKMVKDQAPNMPAEQCDQMTGEYDKVLADLQRMEAKNKPLPAEAIAKIAAGEVPSYGPADAKVTIVEFSDFQCPYCSAAATAFTELKKSHGDRVRFVFRQFPLSFHQQAHLAAQASLAAHAQGKFWEFHDKLFANQKALGREDLEKYAEEIGLDMKAFKAALDDGTYKQAVDDELALGQEVFVEGTPTMFINGTRVGNATDAAAVAAELDKALGS
ncbi:DsbA family protein [Enhygromyxa salina]|uniref:Disulfide bond formation protein D n=1 Tax=Enhygromyxa salina TaxID=215803 RepID=A0A2S9YKG5_9BACT|nr:thioredoxin domain-containing protein [Enhygromyxa salina]PRQ05595.1 Disulfide bond formation protein D precursor [Enhygromyxa salina]